MAETTLDGFLIAVGRLSLVSNAHQVKLSNLSKSRDLVATWVTAQPWGHHSCPTC